VVLLTIAVRADRRRQGVGRALVRALAERARRAGGGQGGGGAPTQAPAAALVADVALSNAPALALLASAGFSWRGEGAATVEAVLELRRRPDEDGGS
jgi:ribosomal protein S18 acetylase RimI-like enzyme